MNKQLIGFLLAILFVLGMTNVETNADSSTYKVKTGDTLWDIAEDNDISVVDLFSWNELHTAMIFPDQELTIVSNIKTYVVQKGDTLFDIAEAHQVSVSDLRGWNAISGHLIFPGDELTIGGPKKIVQKTKQQSNTASAPAATKKKQAVSGPPAKSTAQTKSTAKTQPKQAPTAASGKEMTVTATAYTAYCKGCSGTTYTGINLRANPNQKVIAVDPSVIPLGSRVWVEGYGEAIAGDIGGAIKGNIIDVFLEHKQDAYNWGRRTVKIKILD